MLVFGTILVGRIWCVVKDFLPSFVGSDRVVEARVAIASYGELMLVSVWLLVVTSYGLQVLIGVLARYQTLTYFALRSINSRILGGNSCLTIIAILRLTNNPILIERILSIDIDKYSSQGISVFDLVLHLRSLIRLIILVLFY